MPRFFERVDRVLRRSLGVSETAQADTTVKPAPPVEYAGLSLFSMPSFLIALVLVLNL